jgi:hypothetical protein
MGSAGIDPPVDLGRFGNVDRNKALHGLRFYGFDTVAKSNIPNHQQRRQGKQQKQ